MSLPENVMNDLSATPAIPNLSSSKISLYNCNSSVDVHVVLTADMRCARIPERALASATGSSEASKNFRSVKIGKYHWNPVGYCFICENIKLFKCGSISLDLFERNIADG